MRHRPLDLLNTPRRRRGVAWLATVALLVNALLPTAFLVGAAQAWQPIAIGFCRAAHNDLPPAGKPAAPALEHCIFCFVVAVAPAPTPPAALAEPQVAAAVGAVSLAAWLPRRPVRFAAAQPRGPPVAA